MSKRSRRKKKQIARRANERAQRKSSVAASSRSLSVLRQEVFSGPLPHPDLLEKYDGVCPGAADRLIGMAETQAAHRQALESRALDHEHRRSMLGTCCGLIVAIAGFVTTGWVAWIGHPTAATIIGSFDLAALVGVFIYGKYHTSKERRERLELLTGGGH